MPSAKSHNRSSPKRKTKAKPAGSALRNEKGQIVVPEDAQVSRSSEPIFGISVPIGECFEFPLKEYSSHDDVVQTVEATVYDVLNGFMPQQKGEFVLRAMNSVTKSLIAKTDSASTGSNNNAIARLLNDDIIRPETDEEIEFKKLIEKSKKRLSK